MRADPPRILVVHADRALTDAITPALREAGYDVRTEHSAAPAVACAEKFLPDLAIVDILLPGNFDGVRLAKELRRAADTLLMFLTGAETESRIVGYEAGGDDCLSVPFSIDEFILRVRALLRRTGRSTSTVHQVGSLLIDRSAHLVRCGVCEVGLTPTEFELLDALAERPGQVLSKLQLLARVWGFDAYDENLVEVHVSSLRRKLEACGPRVVHTVRGVGYVVRC